MKRTLAGVLTSLVVLVVSAELLGLAAFYIDTGTLFYGGHKSYPEILPTPGDRLVPGEAVHPYFGFTHHPGTPFDIPESLRAGTTIPARLKTNNFGFASPVDYPVRRSSDRQFLVGIFGGSVAVWFCQIGAPRLVEHLRRHPYFSNRDVVPLCLSHEGYKQPQQALVLGYFLSLGQPLDLVVNIDGFNDVALGSLNNERGLDPSMPSAQHLESLINVVNQSTLTPDKLASLDAIFRDRRLLVDLQERLRTNRFASVNFLLDRYHTVVRNRYVQELGRFNRLPSNPLDNTFVQVAPPLDPRDRAHVFSRIAAGWANASALMHDMVAQRSVTYIHFLQPNQYYGARRFGAAEAKVAINDASPYRPSVMEGYPLLVDAGSKTLRSRNVSFFDATGVFDRESSAVYMDDCCHYTKAGNEILADFVAASILESPGPWRVPGGP